MANLQRKEGRKFLHPASTGDWSWKEAGALGLIAEETSSAKNLENGLAAVSNSRQLMQWCDSREASEGRGFLGAIKRDLQEDGRMGYYDLFPRRRNPSCSRGRKSKRFTIT